MKTPEKASGCIRRIARLQVGSWPVREILNRTPMDEDVIIRPELLERMMLLKYKESYPLSDSKYIFKDYKNRIQECEIAWPESTGDELLNLCERNPLEKASGVASRGVILALKLSHRFKAGPHFLKTMRDIQLLRKANAEVPSCLEAWLQRREKETLKHKYPNLNQGRMGFFTDNVPYVYVHDTIHLALARTGRPAYEEMQEGTEVKVYRKLWDLMPEDRKLDTVMEEAYVLALERHQIPNDFQPPAEVSFKLAMEKLCTTISSGWWREWAWEHYDLALRDYNRNYVEVCRRAIASGEIKKVVKDATMS